MVTIIINALLFAAIVMKIVELGDLLEAHSRKRLGDIVGY
jgi:hypothetical protein